MPNNQGMTKDASQRIQSSQAKNGGDMSGRGFASRAQSAGDKHANSSNSAAGAGGFGSNTSAGNAGNKAQK
ncbi:hypothetical protein LAWI1_G003979 [Lachnellula willkommii]|uniref:SMP domain-containing protein n=1 Tax=Lachnellula willkommii TaxID=215461 RepID=A0A559M5R3_9HELO|nr:hypothetical protein LAWI1_G003979 [Lachnellula willkommii]